MAKWHVHTDGNSWDLPEDLFEEKAGEVRPSKPVKRVVKAKAEVKPLRRSISDVGVGSWHKFRRKDVLILSRMLRATMSLRSEQDSWLLPRHRPLPPHQPDAR